MMPTTFVIRAMVKGLTNTITVFKCLMLISLTLITGLFYKKEIQTFYFFIFLKGLFIFIVFSFKGLIYMTFLKKKNCTCKICQEHHHHYRSSSSPQVPFIHINYTDNSNFGRSSLMNLCISNRLLLMKLARLKDALVGQLRR